MRPPWRSASRTPRRSPEHVISRWVAPCGRSSPSSWPLRALPDFWLVRSTHWPRICHLRTEQPCAGCAPHSSGRALGSMRRRVTSRGVVSPSDLLCRWICIHSSGLPSFPNPPRFDHETRARSRRPLSLSKQVPDHRRTTCPGTSPPLRTMTRTSPFQRGQRRVAVSQDLPSLLRASRETARPASNLRCVSRRTAVGDVGSRCATTVNHYARPRSITTVLVAPDWCALAAHRKPRSNAARRTALEGDQYVHCIEPARSADMCAR